MILKVKYVWFLILERIYFIIHVSLSVKSKQEHIQYWLHQSADDWEASQLLFIGKKYLHSLFLAHLSLEKISKAHWINTKETNIPPKTHNLIYLLSETTLALDNPQKEFLLELNRFQIKGR
jgi:HEPN domain-containing protein